MKLVSIVLVSLTLSAAAFAKKSEAPQCADQAVYAAVAKNYKSLDVSTSSCGVKALNVGSQLETYVVCTSDETDPMEYIVTVRPSKYDVKKNTSKKCVVEYVSSASEGSTPSFESEDGLVKGAQECSVEYGDGKINCSK